MKFKYLFLLTPLLLAHCGKGNPSTSEVRNLIINEGIESGKKQIKRDLYQYFLNVAVNKTDFFKANNATEDAYGGIHGFQAMAKFDQIKGKINLIEINDKNLKKIVTNIINVQSSDCSPKKGFDNFYDCTVNLIQLDLLKTNGYNSNLRTINISFRRMDDGSLSELSTPDFNISNGMNAFDTIMQDEREYYFIDLSQEKKTISPNNDSEYLIKNKKMYFDLMNDLKSIKLD